MVQIAGGVMGKEVYLRGQKNSYDHHRWITELNWKRIMALVGLKTLGLFFKSAVLKLFNNLNLIYNRDYFDYHYWGCTFTFKIFISLNETIYKVKRL